MAEGLIKLRPYSALGNRHPPNSSSFVSFTRFTQLHPGLIHFLLGLNTSFGTQFQLLDIAHQCSPYFSSPMLEANSPWYCTRCPPVMSKLIFTCLSHISGLSIKIKHQKPIIQSISMGIPGSNRWRYVSNYHIFGHILGVYPLT